MLLYLNLYSQGSVSSTQFNNDEIKLIAYAFMEITERFC